MTTWPDVVFYMTISVAMVLTTAIIYDYRPWRRSDADED